MKQQQLFSHPQLRRSDGRFCTKEQYIIDKTKHENIILKHNCQKYCRAWLASAKRAQYLERQLVDLKNKINALANG
jgi:hypothetical protein